MPTLEEKTKNHPCYSGKCQNGRIHLPVAPSCNIQCNYCNRRYDCVNESRPGITSNILSPTEALERYKRVKNTIDNIKVVGIAGPGDALENFENTRETFRLIREYDPEVTFCLSTNGLYLDRYASELRDLGITHITVTINTTKPETAQKIYKFVKYDGKIYTGAEGAALLLEKQWKSLKLLGELGIVAKVNTVLLKGINDEDIIEVSKKAKEYGAFIGNVMQLIPAQGSAFANAPLTSNTELNELRKKCGEYLHQMYHCAQCRADAIGALGKDCSALFRDDTRDTKEYAELSKDKSGDKDAEEYIPQVKFSALVTSSDRRLVNQHFGHAKEFYIYTYENGLIRLKEIKKIERYCTGNEDCGDNEDKLSQILDFAKDVDVVITERIGYHPKTKLEESGKKVISTYGYINEEIHKAASLV